MSWTEKYAPKKLSDFAGQNKPLNKLKEWYENWEEEDKALLLHGPPGNGKTASVYALAEEKDLHLMEINASDERNKKRIKEKVGSASQQQSLFGKKKIILIDEIDGLSGRKDRGGVGALNKLIKKSRFPIVLTANDPYDSKLKSLRRYVEMVDYGKVHLSSMTAYLAKICEEEGIEVERNLLKQVARQTSGDLRSAINDLESVGRGKEKIEKEDIEVLGNRQTEQDIFEVLKVIFKTKTAKTAKNIVSKGEKDPDELFWWIEQNIPNEYKKSEETAKAMDILSRASIFKARIRRRQNWSLMKYWIALMSAGVSLSKEDTYKKFTRYQPPQRLKAYGRSKAQRKKMNSISKKLKENLHCSSTKIKTEYIPLFKWLIKNVDNYGKDLQEEYELTEKELKTIKEF